MVRNAPIRYPNRQRGGELWTPTFSSWISAAAPGGRSSLTPRAAPPASATASGPIASRSRPGGAEFDPAAFWQTLCAAAREAIARAGVRSDQIAAITATSQRQGNVFLDE